MDAALLSTLGLLDCVVFKRISAGKYTILYNVASWSDELLPETINADTFEFAQNSLYLDDFLIDAETLFQNKQEGRVDSGLWSEQLPTQILRLEASAIVSAGECYLVVHKINAEYQQKQQTLQLARELLLSSDKVAAQHEYLHARLDDLLSEPSDNVFMHRPVIQALERTELGVIILDASFRLVSSNPAMQALFTDVNIKLDLPTDKLILQLFKTQYPESERIFATKSAWTGEIYWLNPPKQGKWLKLSIHPIKSQQQQLQNWLLTISDTTQIKFLLKRNEKLTHFDALTELPNRQFFWNQLENKIQLNRPFYLLYIDIKQFKRINELHGHLVGDELIFELSKRLKTATHSDDLIARIGGTEFAVLMELNNAHSQISSEDQDLCVTFANALIDACRAPFYLQSGQKCEIGLNIGATAFPKDANSAEELMKFADLAAFSAKKKSSSNLQFYSKQLVEASRKRIEMEEALRHAISNNEFELFLQPIINLKTGEIIEAEALIRWRHSDGHLIGPDEFIPLAEQTGLIIPIGKWVISQACVLLGQLNQLGKKIKLSINVSPRQVSDRHLFEYIRSHLEKEKIDPKQFVLELTEGVLIDNYDKVYYLLDEVRKLGMSVSIDDFGTGYSSLAYLQKLPIDHLKIDRSFIKELTQISHENGNALILAIIAMAHSLKLEVIAEGVETILQKDFLQANHCNIVQGFLFSHPLPFEAFCELLTANDKLKH